LHQLSKSLETSRLLVQKPDRLLVYARTMVDFAPLFRALFPGSILPPFPLI